MFCSPQNKKPNAEKWIKDTHDLLENDSTRSRVRSHLSEIVDKANGADRDGTTILQIQTGFFRLIQGAAYRCHKPKYALDFHTHQAVKNLPYLFVDFVSFVRESVELYKLLGVVDQACHVVLDDLVDCVEKEKQNLQQRIQEWTDEKHEEVKKKGEEMKRRVSISTTAKSKLNKSHLLQEIVHWADEWKEHRVPWLADEGADKKQLRMQQQEHHNAAIGLTEGFDNYDIHENPTQFLDVWQQVLYDSNDENLSGCVVKVGWWYEEFMPRLLRAFSCVSAKEATTEPTEEELDHWFQRSVREGVFKFYAADIVEGWEDCNTNHKVIVYQSWRLNKHYINGLQKQRERSVNDGSDHRDSGDISQYTAFIDVYLGRSYVEQGGMRVSFPYFIGPATWILFHTIAEIAANQNETAVVNLIGCFQTFIVLFAKLYACPYCRHHLNEFVALGKERQHYPVEYLLLGWEPTKENLTGDSVTFQDKIQTIRDASSLRLFVWKLHNAVNSSIERSELWYQKESDAIYTSRYWPNVDAELYRSRVMGTGIVSAKRISNIVRVVKAGTKLEGLREDILNISDSEVTTMMSAVRPVVFEIEKALTDSQFLQETYRFEPSLVDPDPNVDESRRIGELVRQEDFTLS